MSKIILAPDSFKGTLSAGEVCKAMEEGIRRVIPEAEVCSVPIADGGEGTVDAFLTALPGERRKVVVQGPFGDPVEACYGVMAKGKTAVIEMAACAGLPLAEGRLDPEHASTYGVGQLMADAVDRGCETIILGLGGSCTNDGGAGAAAGAGAIFYRKDHTAFVPTGGTLEEIDDVDLSALRDRFSGVEILAMCDVENPLFGETGAAYVFGPQKGADSAMTERLDHGLRALDRMASRRLGANLANIPGAGAAGGMGYGVMAFFGAKLRSGIDTVLSTVGFRELLQGADLVLSGEGKLDAQSVHGKVASGVASWTKAEGVPLIIEAGQLGEGFEPLYEMGLTAAFSINRAPQPLSVSAPHTAENIALLTEEILRLWNCR